MANRVHDGLANLVKDKKWIRRHDHARLIERSSVRVPIFGCVVRRLQIWLDAALYLPRAKRRLAIDVA